MLCTINDEKKIMSDNTSVEESKQENDEQLDDSDGKVNPSPPKPPSNGSPSHLLKSKIDVLLKPAGDAPIMKKKKWSVERSKRISWVSEFIKKYLKFEPTESMFLYVNQSFAPSPDTEVGSIFDCFGSDGKLVLHYCKSQAWG